MRQLAFNSSFEEIVESTLDNESILEIVKEYVQKKLINNNILSIEKEEDICYLCPLCFEELNEQSICLKCNRSYSLNDSIWFNKYDKSQFYFYYFDIYEKDVYLYKIYANITLNEELKEYKNELVIDEISLIKKDGIYDCINNEFKKYEEFETKDKDKYFVSYLYLDNLDELKNNELYKYSHIWDLKEEYNETNTNLESLVIYPVFHKEFEYLVKQQFFYIALNETDKINYKGSFLKTFNVSKDRINRFNRKELSLKDIEILQKLDVKNKDLLFSISHYACDDVFIKYLEKKKYNTRNLKKYLHYINSCNGIYKNFQNFKEKLKDENSILYPDSLDNLDNYLTKIMEEENTDTDISIKEIGNLLSINNYENNDYIIRPIMSLEDLIKEATMQRNCLMKYFEAIINGKSQIYVMRDKENIDKSLVTIEVVNNKVNMAKLKFNKDVPDNLMSVINNWEKSLIEVTVN